MPRFTLTQLLMGTALFAIVLVFTQAEGCGRRVAMIESLSFSSDDSRIAVAKLNAHDACTPLKVYKANVARTVSWLDASDGNNRRVIHQDFQPGNCGPAFRFWRVNRTTALCNPSNDHIAMTAFGGGDLTRNIDTAEPTKVSLGHSRLGPAPARGHRYAICGGFIASGRCGGPRSE